MAAPAVRVRLADGARSGLASMVQQFLEQDLTDFEGKRRRASRLRGKLAMTAVDHEVTVTLEFAGDQISIWDGERAPLDASIAGPYRSLVGLLQGESHPLVEHLRGRLRVRSSLRKPFFPLRVHGLMKLPPVEREARARPLWAYAAAAGLAAAAISGAVAAALLLT
ncbi:MAG: hypothetical protein Q7T33_11280 [Dehalococcoidia bacterium]|nr:hypothetical protein [Dehalococcoidia bacterium]